ncbi:MAG: ABC transporter permease [Bacteroidota bacterium]|nr:ABC transporter permease [Bacteroidota bacterium]
MMTLLRYELLKTYRKLRTYIGFGLIIVLVPLAYWGMSLGGEDMARHMTAGLQKDFLFAGNLFNGWFVSHLLMNVLFIHIPFLIVLVAGDVFAGEATSGTFRILLTRPPSRSGIFAVKTVTTFLYTYSLVVFLALFSTGLGLLMFGSGHLLAVSEEGVSIFAPDTIVWRFTLAYILAGWSMCTVASLAMMFSTFVENAIGPIVGSMAVVILFFILGNLPFAFFESIRPYLFTTYLNVWQRVFVEPMDGLRMVKDAVYLGGFTLSFTAVAWIIFTRKDILS